VGGNQLIFFRENDFIFSAEFILREKEAAKKRPNRFNGLL